MKSNTQQGTAMMETVVSLFMLAIGLMGTLAMQANSVNSNQRASLVTEANLIAADMADRILAYNSDDTDADDLAYKIDTATSKTEKPTACAAAEGCAKAAQVEMDTWEWSQLIQKRLPGGVGYVTPPPATDGFYTIQVVWNQDDSFVKSTCDKVKDKEGVACFEYKIRL